MDMMQTRDVPGPQARAQLRHHDVVATIRDARLPAVQRGVLIDYVGTAVVHDTRDDLGGARYLDAAADEIPPVLSALRLTMHRLATAFVHPPIR